MENKAQKKSIALAIAGFTAVVVLAAVATSGIEFSTTISVRTLYRYIDNGIFLKLTNKHLPVKGKKKKKNKKVQVQKRAAAGESIENRPDEVATRETFGHWEMDTVKGKQGVTKSCMLVLTERKTRDEIIFKLKDQKAESVVDALDRLERILSVSMVQVLPTSLMHSHSMSRMTMDG